MAGVENSETKTLPNNHSVVVKLTDDKTLNFELTDLALDVYQELVGQNVDLVKSLEQMMGPLFGETKLNELVELTMTAFEVFEDGKVEQSEYLILLNYAYEMVTTITSMVAKVSEVKDNGVEMTQEEVDELKENLSVFMKLVICLMLSKTNLNNNELLTKDTFVLVIDKIVNLACMSLDNINWANLLSASRSCCVCS